MAGPRGSVDDHLARVVERLVRDFGAGVPEGSIRALVDEEHERYRDARIPHFVPVLVDRAVRQRLRTDPPARVISLEPAPVPASPPSTARDRVDVGV